MLGKEQHKGRGGDGSSSEEEDFMSDSFLTGAEKTTNEGGGETYSEKRRRQLNAGMERAKIQGRAEREKEARAMGLKRNLMDEQSASKRSHEDQGDETGQSNKALKMMMAMGYKHGKGLGRGESEEKAEEENEESKSKALTEPLAIDERWMGC